MVYQGHTNTITKKFKHLGKKNVSQTKGIYKKTKRNIQIKCQYHRDTNAGIIKEMKDECTKKLLKRQ